ncbi:CHAT domain-containing protein [Kamptonema formosum]|uniref:CHAT domain-containing protein n=1 Tax=Kamptonema formosum TaxID=331992 RepID=UPI000346E27A|nr:tetratricopeptide repeat protein [Oscillatoria sp. PCC 10802]
MLGSSWHRLVKFFQQRLPAPPSVSGIRRERLAYFLSEVRWDRLDRLISRDSGANPAAPAAGEINQSDTDCETLFMGLLDGVAEGWDRERAVSYLGERSEDSSLVNWLKRFGRDRLLPERQSHQELARRMVRLKEIGCGELGEVAGELGVRLLAGEAETNLEETPQQPDRVAGESEAEAGAEASGAGDASRQEPDAKEWFYRGVRQYMQGDLLGAIAGWDRAIALKPDSHKVWLNRGLALYKLGRYAEAIASLDRALAIAPDSQKAWQSRGEALNKAGRYEEAIASCQRVIATKPDGLEAWVNLSLALNQEGRYAEALASADRAIAMRPDSCEAWTNRGLALNSLGRYQEAIDSLNRAVDLQPDSHEAWHSQGVALQKAGQYEEAISSFDRAIEIKPDFSLAWMSRGDAAGNSPSCDLLLAFMSPVADRNPDLNLRGYEGKLASYQEGLKYCDPDTHPQGWGLLHHKIGQAHYSQSRQDSRASQYLQEALSSYTEALKTITENAFPELHLEVLQDVSRTFLGLQQTAEAEKLLRRCSDLLQGLLVDPNRSNWSKKQLALKFAAINQLKVDVCVAKGDFVRALELAEGGKNTCLSWLLWVGSSGVPALKYAQIQELVSPTTAAVCWHLSPDALHTFIIKYGAPAPLLLASLRRSRFAGETGFLSHSERQLRELQSWIEEWEKQYGDSDAGTEGEPLPSWRDSLPARIKHLRQILNIQTIEEAIAGESAGGGSEGNVTGLILIPHRDLHRFPLHALFRDGLTTSYLPCAQIGLNLTAAAAASPALPLSNEGTVGEQSPVSPAGENQETLLCVERPDSESDSQEKPLPELPFAAVESEYICWLFPNRKRLTAQEATQKAVEQALADGCDIFHFTGHTFSNSLNPSLSALALTGKQRLNLDSVLKIELSRCRLVCLSAWHSNLTGSPTLTAEYAGLTSAFLSRKVASVASTLWSVQSDASFLVMVEFYRRRRDKSDIEALNEAARWLREVTAEELLQWYSQLWAELPATEKTVIPFIMTAIEQLEAAIKIDPTRKPYAHPYHWAAFTISGRI